MFVREILDREGMIEIADDSITISFKAYKSKKKNEVLKLLIENANNMNIRHPIIMLPEFWTVALMKIRW
jgi:hypothetical protein